MNFMIIEMAMIRWFAWLLVLLKQVCGNGNVNNTLGCNCMVVYKFDFRLSEKNMSLGRVNYNSCLSSPPVRIFETVPYIDAHAHNYISLRVKGRQGQHVCLYSQ